MKIIGVLLIVVIDAAVNAGQNKEVTTQIVNIENIDDPTDLLIVDEFKAENAENIKRKCPKKKKICLNCEQPNFTKGQSPCTDGSKPRCKCKCPKRMRICANGEIPFRNNRHCKDGSNPRCPIAVTPSSTSKAPLNMVTSGAFSTGKPVETRSPWKDDLVLIQPPAPTPFTGQRPGPTFFTGQRPGPTFFTGQRPSFTTTGYSPSWHRDPAPGPTLFTGKTPGPNPFTGQRPEPTPFTGQRPGPTSFTGQHPIFTTTGYSTTWHRDPVVHPSKGVGKVGGGKQDHPTAAAKKGNMAQTGIHGGSGDQLLTGTHLVGIQTSHI